MLPPESYLSINRCLFRIPWGKDALLPIDMLIVLTCCAIEFALGGKVLVCPKLPQL